MKNFNNRYMCKNIHRYFTDISDISVKSNYRYIRVYRYFDPWSSHSSAMLLISFHIIFKSFTYSCHLFLCFMPAYTLEVDTGNYKDLKVLLSLYETMNYKGPKTLLSLYETMTYKGPKTLLSLYKTMTFLRTRRCCNDPNEAN